MIKHSSAGLIAYSFVVIFVAACTVSVHAGDEANIRPAQSSITSDGLMRHIQVLSSDDFEGRAPGTEGEKKTVDYLINQFKQGYLPPGAADTWCGRYSSRRRPIM